MLQRTAELNRIHRLFAGRVQIIQTLFQRFSQAIFLCGVSQLSSRLFLPPHILHSCLAGNTAKNLTVEQGIAARSIGAMLAASGFTGRPDCRQGRPCLAVNFDAALKMLGTGSHFNQIAFVQIDSIFLKPVDRRLIDLFQPLQRQFVASRRPPVTGHFTSIAGLIFLGQPVETESSRVVTKVQIGSASGPPFFIQGNVNDMGLMLVGNRPGSPFLEYGVGNFGRRSAGREIFCQKLFPFRVDQTGDGPHHATRTIELGLGGSNADLDEFHIDQFRSRFVCQSKSIARHAAGEYIVSVNHTAATGCNNHGGSPDNEQRFFRLFFAAIGGNHAHQPFTLMNQLYDHGKLQRVDLQFMEPLYQGLFDMVGSTGTGITGPGIFRAISYKLVGLAVFLDKRYAQPIEIIECCRRLVRQYIGQRFVRHFAADTVNVVGVIGPCIFGPRFGIGQCSMKRHPVGTGVCRYAAQAGFPFCRHHHSQLRGCLLRRNCCPESRTAATDNQNIAVHYLHA